MAFITNLAGIDFTLVDNSGSQRYRLGLIASDAEGGQYMYVQSTASTFAAGNGVVVSKVGGAALLTTAKAKQGGQIGWAMGAVTTRQFCWVQISGRTVVMRVKNACLPGVPLYTTATPGALDDAQGNGTSIAFVLGVRLQAANTATSSNVNRNGFVVSGGVQLLALTGLTQ